MMQQTTAPAPQDLANQQVADLLTTVLPVLLDWRSLFIVTITMMVVHRIEHYLPEYENKKKGDAIVGLISSAVSGFLAYWLWQGHEFLWPLVLFFALGSGTLHKVFLAMIKMFPGGKEFLRHVKGDKYYVEKQPDGSIKVKDHEDVTIFAGHDEKEK